MSIAGQVIEVQVRPRGSSLAVNATAGDSSVTVQDPTLFESTGRVLIDGAVYDYTSKTEADAPPDVDGLPQAYATLALTSGLAADEPLSMPVTLWSGDAATGQALSDVVLLVDTYVVGADPVPVTVKSEQRDKWTAYAGILADPIAVTISDDQQRLEDAPGWTPKIDGTLIDPTTLPPSDGTPTTAPDSSPTPQPFQASGTVAVNWDPPAAATTHVRMFLAPAITNGDGTGAVDSAVTPGSGNLYSNNVQPVATLSTLTLGGEALNPALHYQVALQAWNEIGDAPPSGWVLCQPGFIADAVITYLLLAEQINGNGIAIASTPAGSYNEQFSGTALPQGWAATYRNDNDGLAYRNDGMTVSVESSNVPAGTNGSAMKIDPRTYTSRVSTYVSPTAASMSVADFVLDVRFQFATNVATSSNDTDRIFFGARSQENEPDWLLRHTGLALQINRRYSLWNIGTPDSNYLVSDAVLGQKNGDGSMKAGVWYRVRLSCVRGFTSGAVWSEDQAVPEMKQASTAVSLTAGAWFINRYNGYRDASETFPVMWVDYINVTAYSTGFQVLPDATGDWPQVLDPIRSRLTAVEQKNSDQDARLTADEANIASDGMAIAALQARLGADVAATAITLTSSATASSAPTAAKTNGRAQIVGTINAVSWTANTVYTVGQLPAGTYPAAAINRPCAANRVAVNVNVIISTSGVVQVQTGASAPTAVDLSGISGYQCAA